MKEFDLIARYYAPLAQHMPGALGLKDDAATVPCRAGHEMVVTKDAIAENVHFTLAQSPFDGERITPALIARKLLRTNLSDMAAMGATPKHYLIATFLNHTVDEAWIAGFAEGLRADQQEFGVGLIGGDTVKHQGPLCFSLTLMGEVKKGKALTRAGAKPGDVIFLSGSLGDGALGLGAFRGELKGISRAARDFLVDRYHLPRPRVALGQALSASGLVHAAMDVSDGLVADLEHLCAASGAGAVVHQARIPLSEATREALRADASLWQRVLTGGDDYELLFTAPKSALAGLTEAGKKCGTPITPIGEIRKAGGVTVLDSESKPLSFAKKGYQHF